MSMLPASCHAAPVLVRAGQPPRPLQRVKLGSAEHTGGEREAFVQGLVHDHPEIIPMAEIEPAFRPLIPICRELPTEAGNLDNLWMTPAGGLVLGECKLFRNPEARREVIAQALDYARALAKLRYDGLQAAVRKALRSPTASIWALVQDESDLDEAQFIDAVERRLRQSRFMILIIGDGIQEGVEALTNHLQLHAGLHVGLALVDLSIWRDDEGGLLVVPRVPMRTVLVERGIVMVAASGTIEVQAPRSQAGVEAAASPRAFTASEPEYYEQLEQRRPGLGDEIRSFLADAAALGVVPEFRKTLNLRWQATADDTGTLGNIDTSGRVGFWIVQGAARRLGQSEAGERYLNTIAGLVGGHVKRYEKSPPDVFGSDGRTVDASVLLKYADQWRAAIAAFIAGTVT